MGSVNKYLVGINCAQGKSQNSIFLLTAFPLLMMYSVVKSDRITLSLMYSRRRMRLVRKTSPFVIPEIARMTLFFFLFCFVFVFVFFFRDYLFFNLIRKNFLLPFPFFFFSPSPCHHDVINTNKNNSYDKHPASKTLH